MRKYRFFGGFLKAQENWLNKMAESGYRLTRTGKLAYEFEKCTKGAVQYCVEFVGERSRANAEDYRDFLEDLGYRVFIKNINLSLSVGKLRVRPWANRGGRIATNSATYDHELFIVEKDNDGQPFELHTSAADLISYYRRLRSPWLTFMVVFVALGIIYRSAVFGAFGAAACIPFAFYQFKIVKLRRENRFEE